MATRALPLETVERARRFWEAHGRTPDHVTVLHAFACNPTVSWTPTGLCEWYGIRVDRARAIVAELAASGIVEPVGEGQGYRWSASQAFALPRGISGVRIVNQRWRDVTVGRQRSRR
jgi:hypothetical protein